MNIQSCFISIKISWITKEFKGHLFEILRSILSFSAIYPYFCVVFEFGPLQYIFVFPFSNMSISNTQDSFLKPCGILSLCVVLCFFLSISCLALWIVCNILICQSHIHKPRLSQQSYMEKRLVFFSIWYSKSFSYVNAQVSHWQIPTYHFYSYSISVHNKLVRFLLSRLLLSWNS